MDTKCNRIDTRGMYPSLKAKQRKAAEMLVNPDYDGTVTDLCRELNISRSTLYRWYENRDFNGYIEWLIEKYTNSELSAVWKSLINNCKKGDTTAIKLFFEMKNMYKSNINLSGDKVVFIVGEDQIAE